MNNSYTSNLTPRDIVSELDRHIVGQDDAKRAVAIALRNRWRRQQLQSPMKEEVLPKNILMVGPTGVGKTEISRRLAKLAQAPFIKVEATKFTEVGYVGRDVEQIIRDLVDIAIIQSRENQRNQVEEKARTFANERILDALMNNNSSPIVRESTREKLDKELLEDKEIDLELEESSSSSLSFDVPMSGASSVSMINLSDLISRAGNRRGKKKRLTVADARKQLIAEESEKLIDQDKAMKDAVEAVEQNGIVFLDEIDKICVQEHRGGGDVSREGVQRDLLPLIEGTTVSTKYGFVKTDHILFIASGAFHLAKPSDLLPELQGRLPIRVTLKPLSKDDFRRILTEPEASQIKQYTALLGTEGVELSFTKDAIEVIAEISSEMNKTVEDIGARRLQSLLEKVLDDISFDANNRTGEAFEVTAEYVKQHTKELIADTDLARFVL